MGSFRAIVDKLNLEARLELKKLIFTVEQMNRHILHLDDKVRKLQDRLIKGEEWKQYFM